MDVGSSVRNRKSFYRNLLISGVSGGLFLISGCVTSRFQHIEMYMRQHDWKSAQTSLEDLLKRLPRDGETHLLLAEVYAELDSIQQMRSTLESARSLSPKYIKPTDFIAKKYWFKNFNRGLKSFEQKYYEEAVKRFQLAVEIDPINPHSMQRLADALFMTARYHEAKETYLRVLAQQPDNLIIKNNLAEICFVEKRYEKAVNLCNEILAVKPFDVNALMRRAYSFDGLESFEEAEKDFQLLADLTPSSKLLTDFGLLYFRNGRYEQAISRFAEALNFSSNKASLYRYLGEANWRLRKYKAMIRWYQKLVEDRPNSLLGWKSLALAYEALGQTKLLTVARDHISTIARTN